MKQRQPRRLFAGLAALGLAMILGVTPAAAEDAKIGYIDSARIFAEFKGTEDAQRSFDQEVEGWEKQAEEMKAELDSLQREFQAQSVVISDTRKQEKQTEILTKQSTYETFVQSVWGPQGKLATKNAELVQPIIEKINVVLQKIGDEEGFTIVFDASVGGIVYAADGIDLTDRILEELNKGFE